MKKTATREIHECDVCHKDVDYVKTCLKCGKELCHNCMATWGKEYPHGAYVCGSYDGFYCAECDAVLTSQGTDNLHTAYRVVERLRAEGEAWSGDYRKRCVAAETAVMALLGDLAR